MFEVAESFVSINGEGAHAGEPAVFIRFKGCNLCCSYCDTQWANLPDTIAQRMSVEELSDYVNETGIHNVTLTGGEPMLQKDIRSLTDRLLSTGHRVEIETNGSVDLNALASAPYRPVFTMDYKLPESGMENMMCTDNFKLLQENDTVKFVAGSIPDLERAEQVIKKYGLTGRCHVYFSPVFGRIKPSDMVEFMIRHRLNGVRLQLQLHKFIWHPDTRGV